MKRKIKTLIIFLIAINGGFVSAQKTDTWYRFYDSNSNLFGYKDLKGNLKISPKFSEKTKSQLFNDIIAVNEITKEKAFEYYLLKNGLKIGLDSVCVREYNDVFTGYDCESESKIAFRDKKTSKVGFFDKNGKVIIPAIYNEASPFRNGISTVIIGAKRECLDKSQDNLNCVYFNWDGGRVALINEKNEIIVDNLKNGTIDIDWYSLTINSPHIDTTLFTSYIGKANRVYSFRNFDKEFRKWFYGNFIPKLNDKNAIIDSFLFDEIKYKNDDGIKLLNKRQFIDFYPKKYLASDLDSTKFQLSPDRANVGEFFTIQNSKFSQYLNYCGDYNFYRFPIYKLWISKKSENKNSLTSRNTDNMFFEFLRTEKGYKLIGVSAMYF